MADDVKSTISDDRMASHTKESRERQFQLLERQLESLSTMPPDQELVSGVTVASRIAQLRAMRVPTPPRPSCRLQPDVVYGTAGTSGRALTMHLYTHSDFATVERPGIAFFHGGGWAHGFANASASLASELAGEGYVTASISYRLSDEALWPAALEDAKCAVRWMRSNAHEIGLDSTRIAVAGGSAGGHLAAMIALTPGRFEGTGGWEAVSSEVQAAVLRAPCLDLSHTRQSKTLHELVRKFLGDENLVTEASPINYVSSACPPVLTRVGDQDTATPASVARTFHRILDKSGVPNELVIVPGMAHAPGASDDVYHVDAMKRVFADHLSLK